MNDLVSWDTLQNHEQKSTSTDNIPRAGREINRVAIALAISPTSPCCSSTSSLALSVSLRERGGIDQTPPSQSSTGWSSLESSSGCCNPTSALMMLTTQCVLPLRVNNCVGFSISLDIAIILTMIKNNCRVRPGASQLLIRSQRCVLHHSLPWR